MNRSHVGIILILSLLCMYLADAQQAPLTLSRSLELALDQNPQVLAAQEALALSEAQALEARSAFLPKVEANGSYLYFGKLPTTVLDFGELPFPLGGDMTSIEIETGATHNWQGQVSLQQPIFTFGKLWNTYQRSLASREAVQAELRSVEQQLTLQVQEAFYGVLLAQKYVELSKQAVEVVEAQVGVAHQLRDAGVATDFEVLRAEVQLSSVRSQLVRADNGHELSRHRLKMVLGMEMGLPIEVDGQLEDTMLVPSLDELIQQAMAQRPDLVQLRWQEKAGEKLLKVARAGYLPNISMAGNYSVNDTDRQSRNTTWNVAVVANVPIFNGFGTRAKVHQAEAGLRQVYYGQEQLRDAVELEVRSAYLQLQETEALLEVQRHSVEQATESLRLAQLRYENGMLTSVELIDSQLTLTQAQVNRLQAQHDYVVGLARLRKAIGEGADAGRQ